MLLLHFVPTAKQQLTFGEVSFDILLLSLDAAPVVRLQRLRLIESALQVGHRRDDFVDFGLDSWRDQCEVSSWLQ